MIARMFRFKSANGRWPARQTTNGESLQLRPEGRDRDTACSSPDRKRHTGPHDVIVSLTFSTSAESANGFGRKANCSFSGRLFSNASSA